MSSRPLTAGEMALTHSVFGTTLRCERVRIHRRSWWWFQPASITMAPDGHLWFHPQSSAYRADFAMASVELQAFFLHEMTHVWQVQTGMNIILMRGFWSPYAYLPLRPGKPFELYGIEQQAEIVRHYYLLRAGRQVAGAGDLKTYERLLPFGDIQRSRQGK
jgi:hypothetical protein